MKLKIYIAGGGTGGHIYPALAIGRSLQKMNSDVEITFIGTQEGMESKIIPKEGYPIVYIRSGRLNFSGGVHKKVQSIYNVIVGLFQALRLMVRQRPDFVLGVGGFASGPAVLAASVIGLRTGIWEANAHPGLANRWLSRFVDSCYVVFSQASPFFHCDNIKKFGMPVRSEIEQMGMAQRQLHKNRKPRILIFGGSQGARSINEAFFASLQEDPGWIENIEVIHQIGSLDYERFSEKYKKLNNHVQVLEFIYDMPQKLQWADLVICRGGASAIAEISAFALPSIIIPLPLADSHQEVNARALVDKQAAELIVQKNLSPLHLKETIIKLIHDSERLEKMSKNVQTFFLAKGADFIAKDILQQLGE